jgi:transposase-like protein
MPGSTGGDEEEGGTMRLDDPLFHDEQRARAALEAARWPHGPSCVHCAADTRIARLDGRSHRAGLFYCNECKRQFTVTVGTACHGSKVPLTKWLLAGHLLGTDAQTPISKLQRMLGVTYKTAWLMARRLRSDGDDLYLRAARLADQARRLPAAPMLESERQDRPTP